MPRTITCINRWLSGKCRRTDSLRWYGKQTGLYEPMLGAPTFPKVPRKLRTGLTPGFVEIVLSQSSNYRLDLLSSLLRSCDGSFAAHNFGVGSFLFVHVSKRLTGRKKDFRTWVSSPSCDKLQGEEKKEILRWVREKKIILVNQQVSKTDSQSKKNLFSF